MEDNLLTPDSIGIEDGKAKEEAAESRSVGEIHVSRDAVLVLPVAESLVEIAWPHWSSRERQNDIVAGELGRFQCEDGGFLLAVFSRSFQFTGLQDDRNLDQVAPSDPMSLQAN